VEEAHAEGWSRACQLYEYLANGGEAAQVPPGSLRLAPGEVAYVDTGVGYARFYGKNVTYQTTSGFLMGSAAFVAAGVVGNALRNTSAKRRAEAEAAAQWRDQAHVRAVVTNHRILTDVQGRLLDFWHEGVVEFTGDLSQPMIMLRYQVGHPLLLHGPAVPYVAVVLARLLYADRWRELPVMGPIAQAVADRP